MVPEDARRPGGGGRSLEGVAIARAQRGEDFRESGGAFDASGERSFVDEQQVIDELARGVDWTQWITPRHTLRVDTTAQPRAIAAAFQIDHDDAGLRIGAGGRGETAERDLPLDFCCMMLYDRAARSLTVSCVGIESQSLAIRVCAFCKSRAPLQTCAWRWSSTLSFSWKPGRGSAGCGHGCAALYLPELDQGQW